MTFPPPSILLIEDDPDAAFLMQRALRTVGWPPPVGVAKDGESAIRALGGTPPIPTLVILDLTLPLKSGFEVLQWIRQESACKAVPIVVLTASGRRSDIRRAHKLGASSYLVKPMGWHELVEQVKCIQLFWTGLSEAKLNQ